MACMEGELILKGALDLASGFLLLNGFALVVFFLSACEGKVNLDFAVLDAAFQWDDGNTVGMEGTSDFQNFCFTKQQFS